MTRLTVVGIALVAVATKGAAAQNGTKTMYTCVDRTTVASAQLCAAHGGVASVTVDTTVAPASGARSVSGATTTPGASKEAVVKFPKEAVVNFEEGNPDRPVVTGSVYNGTQPAGGVYNGAQPADSVARRGLGRVPAQVLTTPSGTTPVAILCKDGTTVTAARLCAQHGGTKNR